MKFFWLLLLGLPKMALAAPAVYNLLAPLGGMPSSVTMTSYLGGILIVVIGVAGVLAVVMIVVCGIQLVGSPSVSQRTASKECIWNAIIGLALAIGSWGLLNTINPDLLKSDLTSMANIGVSAPAIPPAPTNDPMPTKAGFYYRTKDGSGIIRNSPRFSTSENCLGAKTKEASLGVIIEKTPPSSDTECFEIVEPSQAPSGGELANRNYLCGNDSCVGSSPLSINKPSCKPGQVSDCTNVNLLPTSAMDAVKAIAASTVVKITGGTEPGHASHGPGKPIFDLGLSTTLNTWVRTHSTMSASSFQNCRYRLTLAGNVWWFTLEGNHWHTCKLNEPGWYCKDSDKLGKSLSAGTYVSQCPK